jgi:predicted HicB family RNase H-like nuclease
MTENQRVIEKGDRLTLRINADLKQRVAEAAKADSRSVASWVEAVIRRALDTAQKTPR